MGQGDGCQAGVRPWEHPWVLLSCCQCVGQSWQGRWATAGGLWPPPQHPGGAGASPNQLPLVSGGGLTPPMSPTLVWLWILPFPWDRCEHRAVFIPPPPPPPHLCALLFYVGFDVLWCLMTGLRPFAFQSASVGRTRSASAFPKALSPGSTANPGEPGFGPQHGGLREVPGTLSPSPGWAGDPAPRLAGSRAPLLLLIYTTVRSGPGCNPRHAERC